MSLQVSSLLPRVLAYVSNSYSYARDAVSGVRQVRYATVSLSIIWKRCEA